MNEKIKIILSFSFGTVFVSVILVLLCFIPEPTQSQMGVFWGVLAVAIAGVAVSIPGDIKFRYKNIVKAGGALAVFAMVYFFLPAGRSSEETETLPAYEYSCKEYSKACGVDHNKVYEFEKEYNALNSRFDEHFLSENYSSSLCKNLLSFAHKSKLLFDAIENREKEKNLENLIYLKYACEAASYYKLAYLCVLNTDTLEAVKYSNKSLAAFYEANQLLEKAKLLPEDCRFHFADWKSCNHDAFHFFQFLAMAVNYHLDNKTSLTESQIRNKLQKVSKDYIRINYEGELEYYGSVGHFMKNIF